MHNNEGHINAFIDLNGIPYLLAEYLDHRHFQQIDRSIIKSEIMVDQSDAMRAVVDISIDDIGKRASDNHPSILGNTTKFKNLLKMISSNCEIMNHQLNVLRRGIVIRVDYQLENYRTGQVIRSMTESFRILDRNYFIDINSRNPDDNAIIVNFCNTLVSTINEFTHGQDTMIMRVTNIHLSYEMVKHVSKIPHINQSMHYHNDCYNPNHYGMENDIYNYHKISQNHHMMPGFDPMESTGSIMPPSWSMFNRFYRFDNGANDIVIHGQEVNDPMTKVALIPCGTVRVNRTFIINPGHRIIFKFSIWKNDLTSVSNAVQVAQCLKSPIINDPTFGFEDDYHHIHVNRPSHIHCDDSHHYNHIHYTDPDYENVMKKIHEITDTNRRQNKLINNLYTKIDELTKSINILLPPSDDSGNSEEITPDESTNPDDNSSSDPDAIHEELQNQIDELDNDISKLEMNVDSIPDLIPISNNEITEIVRENSQPSEL